MDTSISASQLIELGLTQNDADHLCKRIHELTDKCSTKDETWNKISKQLLAHQNYAFNIHRFLFSSLYPHWPTQLSDAPAWIPDQETISQANITRLMNEYNLPNFETLHQWSTDHYPDFWQRTIKILGIPFKRSFDSIVNLQNGLESPEWLPGAMLNIVDSCFQAPLDATAIICPDKHHHIQKYSYGELMTLTNRIANSLVAAGFTAGDAIGIAMPMNMPAVAIYLGIIKMGGIVVSIADSFSSQEIAVRLNIAKTKAVFTQDFLHWAGKTLPLYEKVLNAVNTLSTPCHIYVLSDDETNSRTWQDILAQRDTFDSHACHPMMACNILFSSGTTAAPKAIAWNHTTPIKAASDAYYHQNIQAGDILAWPTNLGWMMGPWLIFAALINKASIALYPDAPKDQAFGEFVEKAGVTMLGVVPTLVSTWRQSQCMETLNWRHIKTFSSTGECSNPEDMLYLMSLAGYKPVIEYCGGTEIGGAYITSTVVQNNYPALFTTPALGLNFIILDESGKPSDMGEVAIIPPSIGLSTSLLNADHHAVYFANMPTTAGLLRRHGDQLKRFPNNTYCILGRVDDSMNLGGIKVSAAEIERTLSGIEHIKEVAAVAVTQPNNGPSQLIIFAVTAGSPDKKIVQKEMQKKINRDLNPLFKISDVVFTTTLPKTASNKIMRRVLRSQYHPPV